MAEKAYRTPKGSAIWPRLNTPDTKFKAEGEFSAKMAVDGDDPELEAFREEVEKVIAEKLAEVTADLESKGKGALAKKLKTVSPFTPEEDAETGDETGRIIINPKMTASGISKKNNKPWKRKPEVFNAKGKKLDNPPQIGGGSILRANVELYGYYNPADKVVGCSLRLKAVQVITLVSFGSRSASDYGFGEEEGDDIGDEPVNDFEDETEGDNDGDEDDGL